MTALGKVLTTWKLEVGLTTSHSVRSSPGFESPSKGREPLRAFLWLEGACGTLEQVCPDTHITSLTALQPGRWVSSSFHLTDEESKLGELWLIPTAPCRGTPSSLLPAVRSTDSGLAKVWHTGLSPGQVPSGWAPGTTSPVGSEPGMQALEVRDQTRLPHCYALPPPNATIPVTFCFSTFSGSPLPPGPAVTSPLPALLRAQDKAAPILGHHNRYPRELGFPLQLPEH